MLNVVILLHETKLQKMALPDIFLLLIIVIFLNQMLIKWYLLRNCVLLLQKEYERYDVTSILISLL